MSVRQRSPLLLVCCCLVAYFGLHALHGRHGLEARRGLETRAVTLAAELRSLEAVRAGLAREVALLEEGAADPDFIEELARGMLGLARPADRIVVRAAARPAAGP